MKIQLPADLITELLCLLTAIYCFSGLKFFRLLPFIPFLFCVCVIEFLALQRISNGNKENGDIYNYYILIAAIFYCYCYSVMLTLSERQKKKYWLACGVVLTLLYFNYFFLHSKKEFMESGVMLLQLALICFSCLALYQIAKNPNGPPLLKDPRFIIVSVTFIHCLGGIIVFGFHGMLDKKLSRLLNDYTMPNLNLIMYTGYIYSFYLCQQQRARSSG